MSLSRFNQCLVPVVGHVIVQVMLQVLVQAVADLEDLGVDGRHVLVVIRQDVAQNEEADEVKSLAALSDGDNAG